MRLLSIFRSRSRYSCSIIKFIVIYLFIVIKFIVIIYYFIAVK